MKSLILIFLYFFFSNQLFATLPKIRIKNCYDGDTCTSYDGEKIRLACIDTPELDGNKSDNFKATEARDFLNYLVKDQIVTINRITNDRYGRTVGELFNDDLNIQELIVKKGYGKIYKRFAYQCEWSKK